MNNQDETKDKRTDQLIENIYLWIHSRNDTTKAGLMVLSGLVEQVASRLQEAQRERDFAVGGNIQMQEVIARHGEDLLKLRAAEEEIKKLKGKLEKAVEALELVFAHRDNDDKECGLCGNHIYGQSLSWEREIDCHQNYCAIRLVKQALAEIRGEK